jgi:competence protein ComEA
MSNHSGFHGAAVLTAALLLSTATTSFHAQAQNQLRQATAARTVSAVELQTRGAALVSAGPSTTRAPVLVAPEDSKAGGVVHINTASAEALSAGLQGIGKARAQAIVTFRETNGPFMHLEELLNVSGIGPSTLKKNEDRLRL